MPVSNATCCGKCQPTPRTGRHMSSDSTNKRSGFVTGHAGPRTSADALGAADPTLCGGFRNGGETSAAVLGTANQVMSTAQRGVCLGPHPGHSRNFRRRPFDARRRQSGVAVAPGFHRASSDQTLLFLIFQLWILQYAPVHAPPASHRTPQSSVRHAV
jgi:hypothetical protein